MKRVMVFKTSVTDFDEVDNIRPDLDQLVGSSDAWNFDLEDCDNILRVETVSIRAVVVKKTLLIHGHTCLELPD